MTISMETNKQIAIWEWVAKQKDAPKGLQADFAAAIETLHRAEKIDAEAKINYGKLSQDYFAHHQAAPKTLFEEIKTTHKHSLTKLCDSLFMLDRSRNEAQTQAEIAAQTLIRSSVPFSSGLLGKYRQELFTWVTSRRAIDLAAHGYTEHVTKEVEWIWKQLDLFLDHRHQSVFENLKGLNRLPVVVDPNSSIDERKVILGFWREINLGNYTLAKANPTTTRADRLRLTQYVEALPLLPA